MARRLAAILAADVVGYSRLMGEDEAATVAGLRAHREEVFDPKAAQYGGRTVKLMGDGALMEFASVVDAVTFAVESQMLMRERNQAVAEERRFVFRMGINLGDVMVEGDDLHGDGVNVAARLESLSEPGGICLSRSARDQIRDKLDLDLEDLGEVEVKNIARPVRAFNVRLNEKAAALWTPVVRPAPFAPTFRRLAVAAVAVAMVLVGGLVWWSPWVPVTEPAVADHVAYPLPDKPSLAVLPFANMSGDPDQEYFADGITEDIITDLSKVSGMFVIARNSTFAYKGRQVDVREVAENLGVRYVLEGSVRRAADTVRINAQLIDATTGGHLWAERYDGVLSDVFALQDSVTSKIVDALAVNLSPSEEIELGAAGTANQQAYDAFLRGWAYYRRGTPKDYARAIPHLERAVSLDPEYGRAYAALAAIYWSASEERDYLGHPGLFLAELGTTYDEAVRERGKWSRYLEEGLARPTPLALTVASAVDVRRGLHEDGVATAREAIAMDPNAPVAHEALAKALIFAGRARDGEQAIRTAMRLDPLFESAYLVWLGLAQFGQDAFGEAAKTLRDAMARDPNNDIALVLLLSAVGHLGNQAEAASLLEQLNTFRAARSEALAERDAEAVGIHTLLVGPYTLADTDYWPFAHSADRERLREGLRLAGVPAEAEKGLSPLVVPGATTVDAKMANALHAQGAVFVDTRNRGLWDLGHIPGAHLLDLASDFDEQALESVVGRDEPVVVYCEGPKCLRSSEACVMAVDWGFTEVYYYREGFPSWKAAGHPVAIEN